MQHQQIAPPAALGHLIEDIWYARRDFDARHPSFDVMPDGQAEIIFTFGSPCRLATPAGWQPLPSPLLVGLLARPLRFEVQGPLELIGLKCHPWAVAGLTGGRPGPAGVQAVAHLPLARLQAPLQRLLGAGRVAEALATVAGYVAQHPPLRAADPLVGRAGELLRAAGGTWPVSQVAAAAHATVRTLERRFRQATGRTVKDVAGLLRFAQAHRQLWHEPQASLARLAPALGYADQAHLGREFRRYSATTPAAFARRARGWQQAAASADFVAFLLA